MLKAIGVVKGNSKKVAEDPYQEMVMVPLYDKDKRDIDEQSKGESEDGNEEDDWVDEDEGNSVHQAMAASHAALMKVILAIGKVRFGVTIAQVISQCYFLSFVKLFMRFASALSAGRHGYRRLLGG